MIPSSPRKRTTTLRPTFNVEIIEMDRWSGPKLLETKAFRTAKQAAGFTSKHNAHNTLTVAPEYYTYARRQGGGSW